MFTDTFISVTECMFMIILSLVVLLLESSEQSDVLLFCNESGHRQEEKKTHALPINR